MQSAKNQIKVNIQLDVNGMQISRQVFDGSKGWVSSMGNVADMDERPWPKRKNLRVADRQSRGSEDPK